MSVAVRERERGRDTRCKRGREVGEMERDGRGQGETEVRQLRKKHVTSLQAAAWCGARGYVQACSQLACQ